MTHCRVFRFALLLVLGKVLVPLSQTAAQDRCYECHSLLEDRPAKLYKSDIHFKKGISCSGCHGGNSATDDMEVAMSEKAGFVGVLKGDAISKACARCHSLPEAMKPYNEGIPTDQADLLRLSVHGSASAKEGELILQCSTCHGVHGIVRVTDKRSPVHPLNIVKTCTTCHSDAAYMRSFNPALPVDQLEKYRTSVHGMKNASGDPKPAECASCHGGHGILRADDVRSSVYPTNLPGTCAVCHSNTEYMAEYSIPTDQMELFSRSVHGKALLERRDLGAPACNDCHGNHAAAPPGIESVSNVCGTCHALNAQFFSGSPHKKAFDELGLPECETCHGNHDIVAATNQLIGVGDDAACINCHTEETKGYAFAKDVRQLIDSLESEEHAAGILVEDAERKGMEVSDARFRLRDVRQARLESRTTIHGFNEEQSREVLAKGFVAAEIVSSEAEKAVDEYYFRRIGFGISTVIITIVTIALYMYIRRIEERQRRQVRSA